MADEKLVDEFVGLIGEEATVALLEEFAGTRLYIPRRMSRDHAIARACGGEAASALADRYSPASIRIPLGRVLRIRHYRAAGASAAWIAVRLGMTETGVQKMLRKIAER